MPSLSPLSSLVISHIAFRDCRVHIFSDNLSRNKSTDVFFLVDTRSSNVDNISIEQHVLHIFACIRSGISQKLILFRPFWIAVNAFFWFIREETDWRPCLETSLIDVYCPSSLVFRHITMGQTRF